MTKYKMKALYFHICNITEIFFNIRNFDLLSIVLQNGLG